VGYAVGYGVGYAVGCGVGYAVGYGVESGGGGFEATTPNGLLVFCVVERPETRNEYSLEEGSYRQSLIVIPVDRITPF